MAQRERPGFVARADRAACGLSGARHERLQRTWFRFRALRPASSSRAGHLRFPSLVKGLQQQRKKLAIVDTLSSENHDGKHYGGFVPSARVRARAREASAAPSVRTGVWRGGVARIGRTERESRGQHRDATLSTCAKRPRSSQEARSARARLRVERRSCGPHGACRKL